MGPQPEGRDYYGRWYPDREYDTDPPPTGYTPWESFQWIIVWIVLIAFVLALI